MGAKIGRLCQDDETERHVVLEENEIPQVMKVEFQDENRRGTVYFDALEKPTYSMLDEPADSELLGDYAPANQPMSHPRGSVFMGDPQTLLRSQAAPKKQRLSIVIRKELSEPRVKLDQRGYPGDLTEQELEATLEFRRTLRNHSEHREMVHAFEGVEEEPYALCRCLRARNFSVDETMTMLNGNVDAWKLARQADFFPTIPSAVGCSGAVLLTQYPYLFHGNAKNGCPVNYQKIGQIRLEGIECITNLDSLKWYVMHSIMFQFKSQVALGQKANPDFVRNECISVIDLKGLEASQLNKKTLATLEGISHVTGCFPEMLNRMVVINTPRYFTFFWAMIKQFLEARTVAKIELYSNEAKGNKRLLELVDKKELLSDYGGDGPSFAVVAQKSEKGESIRQTSELMTMNGEARCVVELTAGEKATVNVYMRSEAEVSLQKDGTVLETVETKNTNEDSTMPFLTEVASDEKGPGKFQVSAKPTSGLPTDNFVVHVEVFSI